MPQEFDALVVGAGQAGSPLAHNLADMGWRVALIEREHLGGSCINYGCTPTKTMLASARAAHVAREAGRLGVHADGVRVDLAAVVARKDEIVREWRAGQEEHAAQRPSLTLLKGDASFVGPHELEVGDERLTAPRIFINTGAQPRMLALPGGGDIPVLTNRTIMDLTTAPEHLVVLGGSYIGLEFGQMFRRFGSAVTVVEYADQIVSREDEDVAAALRAALEAEDLRVLTGHEATRLAGAAGDVQMTVRRRADGGTEEIECSHVLMAVGRAPATEGLGLEAAGIETEGGWIKVDEYLETNVPGVYALGDVNGGPAFTHISYNDFQIVLHNLQHEQKRSTAERIVPYALFTDPELGRVGLTQRAAVDDGRRIKVAKIPMSWVARAIESGETEGLMKVVIDADTDRILGAAILGTGGAELVQNLMGLMLVGAPRSVYEKGLFIHPTLTEGFFTLFDNVEDPGDGSWSASGDEE